MPLSRYPRPGHAIAPRLFSDLLQRQAPFGAGRYCDLDESTWKRFDARTCKRLGRALVAELSRHVPTIQSDLNSVKLPSPPDSISVQDLELETRTFNCLRRADIDGRPGGVSSLTIGEALGIRAFGIKSLVDLVTSLESIGKGGVRPSPNQSDSGFAGAGESDTHLEQENVRNTVASQPEVVPKEFRRICRRVGHLPEELLRCVLPTLPDGTTLHDLNLEIRTFNALANAGYADDPDRLRNATIGDLSQVHRLGETSLIGLVDAAHRLSSQHARRGQAKTTVDEELLRLFVPSGDPRRRKIVASYFGLRGRPHSTLESVGKEFGITRERVRQLCAPAQIAKGKSP